MSTFKIGEKVVCVNPIFNLVFQEIYIIKHIQTCSCGNVLVEVNIRKTYYTNTICSNCLSEHENNNMFNLSRFRKLDHKFTENLIAELMQSEYQFN